MPNKTRRTMLSTGAVLLLAGCIPQVAPPYRPAPPPAYQPPVAQPQRADPGTSYAPREPATTPENYASPRRPAPARVSQLPAPRPAWEARPVTPDARVIADGSYTVRPGDTLQSVANAAGAGEDAIARANGLLPPFTLRAGQRLVIPGGRYHLVRTGETGIAIARAYGVPWSQVVAANALADPYILRAGQRVLIPEADRPRSTAERAAAFQLDIDSIITGGEPALAKNAAPARPVPTPRRVLPETAAIIEPERLAGGRFLWPVTGRVVGRFGPVRAGQRNDGIKIAVPLETPVRATADGTVAYAGDGIAALGGLVIIRHGDGWTSVYGYASKLLVRRGQSVKRGQTIALSGDTGYADIPEVHFELRRGRTPVDPLAQLPRS